MLARDDHPDLLDNPDGVSAPGPGGGFAWDGRANTLAEQAKLPLLSPVEMANAGPSDVVAKVHASPYAGLFEEAYGAQVWRDVATAFKDVATNLAILPTRGPELPPLHLTGGMNAYLEKRGALCLGKTSWPVDVTRREFQLGSRDTLQLPVLEQLGLVSSSEAVSEVEGDGRRAVFPVRRYQLTDLGRRYTMTRRAGGSPREVGDLCAATLTLDKVLRWEPSGGEADRKQGVAIYTYKVDAAPWTGDPRIQRVFPVVAGVVRGAGSAQLREGFTLSPQGWVANDLLE